MPNLPSLGSTIAKRRKQQGLRQIDLATQAGVSRATIEALENGRLGELGYTKITKILSILGLDLTLGEANKKRPTLEELLEEYERDQGLGRRN